MNQRIKVEFKVGKHTIFKSPRDLSIEQLECMKKSLALTCRCSPEDIEVIYNKINPNLSKYDISKNGLVCFKNQNILNGIELSFEFGSDEHLDAIKNNNMDKFLKFI